MTAKPLVALSGFFYPVAMLRYFENALRRRDDVEVVTIGPDFGTWLPWKAGMHLPYTVRAVDVPLPQVASVGAPMAFAEARLHKHLQRQPDMWLQVDAGYHFQGRPTNGVNVIVATDPHCLNYDQQRRMADMFYCMQTPYAEPSDLYFPYAYDPVWHRFIEDSERPDEMAYEAALCGLTYENREAWAKGLRAKGHRVFLDTGPSYQDARALYASSVTGFNWSSLKDTVARCYELMAMGVPSAMNLVPDLEELFTSGEHFAGFRDLGGAITASEALIADPGFRNAIRRAARAAVEPHTYDARVQTILVEAGVV